MNINQATVDLVKEFEGFRASAYQDPVGIWTIGYGTTAAAGVGIDPKPGMSITREEAELYLRRGLEKFARQIGPHIRSEINENEFGAFLSLAYNIGPGAFATSTALRRFNAGDKAGAAQAMTWYRNADGRVLPGLVRRRDAEVALFLQPVGAGALDMPVEELGRNPATTLRPGNRSPSPQVRLLQQLLAAQGYFTGQIDGLFGPRTRAAVVAFQDAHNLDADGIVGDRTWEALHRAEALPPRAVTVADLRDSGSETIRAADRTEVGAVAVAGVGSVVTVLDQVAGAEGAIATLDGLLRAYWPVAAFAAVGFGGWYLARRLRSIRLDDAISGRNLGR